jgi:hypothetical protein
LVLLLNGYQTVEQYKRALPQTVYNLKEVISEYNWRSSGFNVEVIEMKAFLLVIEMNCYDDEQKRVSLSVDVVPAFRRSGQKTNLY